MVVLGEGGKTVEVEPEGTLCVHTHTQLAHTAAAAAAATTTTNVVVVTDAMGAMRVLLHTSIQLVDTRQDTPQDNAYIRLTRQDKHLVCT